MMFSSKSSFFIFAFIGIVAVALAGELPIRSFRPPAIPFITQSPEVQNFILDNLATGSDIAWWDGALRGMVGLVRVDGTVYRWLGVYNEDREPSKHVVTFDEADVSPGSHDIANTPMSSMDDCNRFCSRYPTCSAFVLDEKLNICYLKDTVEPRVDSEQHAVGIVVPDADKYPGKDVAPGSCDISKQVVSSDSECAELCAESADCKAYIMSDSDMMCYLKSCAEPVVSADDRTAYFPKELHPNPIVQPPAATQVSVVVYPTRTVIEFEAGNVSFTVTSLSSLFADDFDLMSRPTTTVYFEFSSLDGNDHDVSVYMEAEASHTVSNEDEDVEWDAMTSMVGVRMGNKNQDYFKIYGDHVGMDWGYLNLAAVADPDVSAVSAAAGKAEDLHKSFTTLGSLPGVQKGSSRARDGPVVAAVAASLTKVSASGKSTMKFIYGYDDVISVYYFGDKLLPYWTQKYSTFDDVMKATVSEFSSVMKKSEQFDDDLLQKVAAKGGDRMATLIALAYRQTLAAIKAVWNDREKSSELYLLEISTNSDLNTVDVVFPASPLFLYFNQDLLWKLLNPVLRYGNNETWIKYGSPYSPHQLGVYPVGNDTTEQQEQMPTENTGNMFLMLLAILQRNGGDPSFYYPRYFPLLKSWADYLLSRLPFIQNELCTDDFLGPIANNTNLAAKGIIALSAFSDLCKAATKDPSCDFYEQEAERLAKMWIKYGMVDDPIPHVALCFHKKDTWSTKYNLLWQKILNFTDRPFPQFRELVNMEEKYYLSIANKYGFPVDSRTSAAKLDWIAWAAALAYDDDTYNKIVDMFYQAMNDMETRCPMTDYFYTEGSNAVWTGSFVSRPVVGGLFAKMLV